MFRWLNNLLNSTTKSLQIGIKKDFTERVNLIPNPVNVNKKEEAVLLVMTKYGHLSNS